MKGDFSRSTFRPHRHYSGVRMQQGRVQLDSDWNENLDILLHRIETETVDVVGECGVPVHNAAFGVVTDFTTLSQPEKDLLTELGFDSLDPGDFYLTRGRAYVDGILVENDATLPFSQQPAVLPKGNGMIADPGIYLLYLDVWHRHITALEDPRIREVALGGPDTATRTQVIWQAKAAKVGEVGDTVTCADDLHPWPDPGTGTLQARTQPADVPDDPCVVPPGAGYKRLENQLYRVEIHRASGETGGPTFKWSRDNGSVVVAISEFGVDGSNAKVRVTSLGRDDVLGLHENDWIEISDDATELAGQHGILAQIDTIDPDNILTLSGPVTGFDLAGHPKARRWDVNETQTQGDNALSGGVFVDLEGGIQVQFDAAGTYRTGDYWLIPARTVPGQYGDIEWPMDENDPAALLPFGVTHHYCKLAILTAELVERFISITDVKDCRKKFPPLTELPAGGNCCCSVSVGEGGDYPDLQSAIDARPADVDQWRICVIEGELHLEDTVKVDGAAGLVISGCGRQTIVYGPQGKPVFFFNAAEDVQLDNLTIQASAPDGAILFVDSRSVVISNLLASNQLISDKLPAEEYNAAGLRSYSSSINRFGKPAPLIVVDGGSQVEIRDNDLYGLPAVQAGGRDLAVLRNRIGGGGVQIVPPASLVRIEDNVILKGFGPGIQLGGGSRDAAEFVYVAQTYTEVPAGTKAGAPKTTKALSNSSGYQQAEVKNPLAGIANVTISRNLIGGMRGSGIVTTLDLADVIKMSDVEFLEISDNQIIRCCLQPDVVLKETVHVGGGMALIGIFSAQIDHNLVAMNGRAGAPACGIFVLDGSDIDIDDNRIVENGSIEQNPEPAAYQAGIAAQFVFGNYLGLGRDQDLQPGYPALRVRGNEVVCPAGQALTVMSMGGVVVDGNTLVTRERLKQPASPLDFGEKGACVAILDLGVPVWLPDIAILLQMLLAGNTSLHMESSPLDALAGWPDGRVMFHNNQVTFNTDIQETVESQGDLNAGWPQRIWNAATFSALFVSLDDVSLNANQFQASAPSYALTGWELYLKEQISLADFLAYLFKFIHVGSGATTVRAEGNGLAERWFSNGVSYASNASMMNITTGNESTHALATNAPKRVEDHNLSLTS
jgi:hypothetical protein